MEKSDLETKLETAGTPEAQRTRSPITDEKRTEERIENFRKRTELALQTLVDFALDEASPRALESGDLPETGAELEKLVSEIQKREIEIRDEKSGYKKMLDKVFEDIKNSKDLDELRRIIAYAREVAATFRRLDSEHEALVTKHNGAAKKLFGVRQQEAGFDNSLAVGKRRSELREKQRKLRNRFLGLGGIINRGGIMDLDEEISSLYRLEKSVPDIYYMHPVDRLERIYRNAFIKVDEFNETFGNELKLEELKLEESDETLSQEVIKELNVSYINEVRKKMARVLRDRGRPRALGGFLGTKLGTKEERENGLKMLEESFSVDMNFKWNETPDNRTKREDLQKSIGDLPYGIRDVISPAVRRGEHTANEEWSVMNRALMKWRQNRWNLEYSEILRKAKARLDQSEKGSWDLRSKVSDKIYKLTREEKHLNASSFDPDRFRIFRTSPSIRKLCGDSALEKYETKIGLDLLDNLYSVKGTTRDGVEKLMKVKCLPAVPYLLLNAFRVGKYNGTYPFLVAREKGEAPPATQYARNFTPDDIVSLKTLNLPGLMEIIDLVKSESASAPENAIKVYANIEKLSMALLERGSEEAVDFVIYTIGESEEPLGGQGEMLRKFLKKDSLRRIVRDRDEASKALLRRFERYESDPEALSILIEEKALPDDKRQAAVITIARSEPFHVAFLKLGEKERGVILSEFRPFILEETKTAKPYERLEAFAAAKKLGLEITPTASDVVYFFETIEDFKSNQNPYDEFIALAEGVNLSESDCARIIRVIANEIASGSYKLTYKIDQLKKFIEPFPTGEILKKEELDLVLRLLVSSPEEFIEGSKGICTDKNWQLLLSYYILVDGEELRIDKDSENLLRSIFSASHPENRDLCLKELQKEYREYIGSGGKTLPIQSSIIVRSVDKAEGAGDLKYIEGIATLMSELEKCRLESKKIATYTGKEFTLAVPAKTLALVCEGLLLQEERFDKERWDENDKTAFYNISRSIIEAAPSLYTDFLELFKIMNARELKQFAREYYPLYQANLVVLQNENGLYNARKLVKVRKRLEDLRDTLAESEDKGKALMGEKEKLVKALQQNIEQRFGLKKLPETITDEHIRSMQDCIRYLANLRHRDATKELLIAFYLGLNLNGEWETFRAGGEIDLSGYFDEKKTALLKDILERRKELFTALEKDLGLAGEDSKRFFETLQEETISNMIGNIQTIDVKLGNAKRSIEDLADPDIYEDKKEKESLALVMEKGRLVGATLAKIFGRSSGKNMALSREEMDIEARIREIYEVKEWKPAEVKKIQDVMQIPSLVSGIIRKLDEEKVDENIRKLESLLKPSDEIIAIMNEFGEEFKPTSGAMALSQDLTYLENIIVKNDHKVTPENKVKLNEYLGAIRTQMGVLESLYARTKEYFEKIKKSTHGRTNRILKDRLSEIETILYQKEEASAITTKVTANLNTIIENMRQCLGCLRKEVNNDTNLTFGDPNKFYVVSQSGSEKGSNADQIAFFVPVEYEDGSREVSFVLDQVYGAKSADVLVAHVNASLKKYALLKKEFNNANMSIYVTDAAMMSVGLEKENAAEKISALNNSLEIKETKATADILKSELADHYIEFGGAGARTAGGREISGLRISLKA